LNPEPACEPGEVGRAGEEGSHADGAAEEVRPGRWCWVAGTAPALRIAGQHAVSQHCCPRPPARPPGSQPAGLPCPSRSVCAGASLVVCRFVSACLWQVRVSILCGPLLGLLLNILMHRSRRLWLCRHGQTAANAHELVQGAGIDLPLNEIGKKQADQLGKGVRSRAAVPASLHTHTMSSAPANAARFPKLAVNLSWRRSNSTSSPAQISSAPSKRRLR
jgi:hypothetical protein